MDKPLFSLLPLQALQTLAQVVPPPPPWLQAELHNRLVLLLNHVLMQEPLAMERLRRQAGQTVHVRWGERSLWLRASPAGLLALAEPQPNPALRLSVVESSAWALAQRVLGGEQPALDIQGDVQLAADVAWLVDNVRWDVEEDLSRWLGDAAAHGLVGVARGLAAGLRTGLAQGGERVGQWRERMAAGRGTTKATP